MLFHQTRQISPSSQYSPHTLLQKMHLRPLFIPAFPAPFTNASPSFLTTFHAMVKAYTQYKSSALFYEYTFSRFYVITEVSQIKFPHHHPRCTVNTVLKTNPAFCLVPYSLHPPKTALHQAQQIKPYPEYSSSSLLLQIAPFYGITE